jgi:hypothetical protein
MKQKFRWLFMSLMLCFGISAGWAETETYKLTIDGNDFNTTSYAANNNEKTSLAICTNDPNKTIEVKWISYQVYKNTGQMQWQNNKGYIYNSTSLGTITDVTITKTDGTFTTYYGDSSQPSSSTTVGGGFFQIKVGNATGKTSKVEITFEIQGNNSIQTTTTIDATGITTTDVHTSTDAGQLTAKVTANNSPVSGATVTWSSSNTNVATIDNNGNVTLVAAGTTTITASYAGEENQYQPSSATYQLKVINSKLETYTKVTSYDELEDGDYLIVYEEGSLIFDGSLETLDASENYQEVEILNGVITASSDYQFTINKDAGTIKSSSGYYIGHTKNENGLSSSPTDEYTNEISLDDGNAVITSGGAYLRFNSASNQMRFRYFKSSTYTSQKAIALYKKGTPVPSLSFAYTEVTTNYVTNETYTQQAVSKNMDTPEITYSIESLDAGTDVANIATIDATTGKVSFVGVGDVKITASTTYNEQDFTAYYTLHIVEPTIELFELVTNQDEIVDGGEYLIVEKTINTSAKAYNGQSGTNHYAGETTVTINGIEIDNAAPKAHVIELEATGDDHWYLKDQTDNCYLTRGSTNGYLYFDNSPTDASKWDINVELVNTTIVNTADPRFQIKYNGTESYNGTNFSSYTGVFSYIQLYKRATALADAGIYYNEPTSYNINLGEPFSTPTLQNPNKVSPVVYSSSNPSAIAVNTNTGAVTVKRSGSATISAIFKGNAAYKKTIATYQIYVSKIKNEGLLFNETFDKLWANGGNDAQFTGSVAKPYNRNAGWEGQHPGESDNNWDKAWTTDEVWVMFDTDEDRDVQSNPNSYVQAGNQCAKFGAGNPNNGTQTNGVLTTRAISMGEGVTQGTLTFSAAGWGTGENELTVSATGCTITYFSHTGNSTVSGNTITLENGVWNDFVFHITDVTGDIQITFKGWRGFIDEIAVGGPYSVTIGSTGYATLYYGSAPLVIPEGVTAYTLQYDDVNGYKDVTKGVELKAGDKLAAGTAVVLRGEPGTYNFPFAFEKIVVNDPNNVLKGSDVQTLFDDPAYEYFILGNLNGEIGFYHQSPSGGKYVNNGAHKAFLQIPVGESILNDKGANVKGLSLEDLDDMTPTSIKDIDAPESLPLNNNVYYNISGQRVSRPVSGIYIINGKKVIFK